MAGIKAECTSPNPKHKDEWLTLQDFQDPIRKSGGCMQFIMQHVEATPDEVLATQLASFFNVKVDLAYTNKDVMLSSPSDEDTEHIFRLGDLGYDDQATTTGQPRLLTCLSLIDSIFTDGFITQAEPLLMWRNPQTIAKNSFWMSFVKGHTRACTALAMAIILMDRYQNAEAVVAVGGGNFLESFKAIRVRVAICAPDVMAVAFKNAALAYRGSIRQAHDVLNWIQKLEKVSIATGVTPDDVLTKWNNECPSEAKVTGNKRTCCMNILKHINLQARTILINHASNHGSQGAFTDDAFTSKKIFPGYKNKAKTSAKWIRWQTVSHDSFILMMQHMIKRHETTDASMRTKITKAKIEKAAELSALASAIKQDVLEAHQALPPEHIQSTFIAALIDNDPNLLMSLEAALADADKDFNVMDLPVLNDVIAEWEKTTFAATATVPPVTMRIGATELEAQEFNLWKLRVLQDVEHFAAWSKMIRDQEARNYYKKVQHNLHRAAEALNAARSLFDEGHHNCCVILLAPTDARSFTTKVFELKKHLVKTHVLPGQEAVATWSFLQLGIHVRVLWQDYQHSAWHHGRSHQSSRFSHFSRCCVDANTYIP